MGDFQSATLWIQLAFLMSMFDFILDLTAFATPGWSGFTNYGCGGGGRYCGSSGGVEFSEVVAFLCLITGVVLIIALVFLDKLKGNKPALIAFVVLELLGGLLAIIGVAVFNSQFSSDNTYSTLVTVMCGLLALLAGVFGILELVQVSPDGAKVGAK